MTADIIQFFHIQFTPTASPICDLRNDAFTNNLRQMIFVRPSISKPSRTDLRLTGLIAHFRVPHLCTNRPPGHLP